MPFNVKVRVVLKRVEFSIDAKQAVADKVRFQATLTSGTDDPVEVGNKDQDFTIPENRVVALNWSKNLRGKSTYSEGKLTARDKTVKLRFDCLDQADPKPSLGAIEFEIHKRGDCWKQEIRKRTTVPSGNYTLVWTVYLKAEGRYKRHDPNTILASREHQGAVQWSTVSGVRKSAYLGIVPVVPLFSGDEWPTLPAIAYADQEMNPVDEPSISATSAINTIHNPPVIPILAADEATTNTAAKIMYTMYAPSTLNFTEDDKRLEWRKISGDGEVAFVAKDAAKPDRADKGLKVLVRGTADGEVVLGVHFDGKVLTKYRALVKPLKKLPCRFNLLTGKATLLSWKKSKPLSTPPDVEKHRKIANIYLRQLGVELVADTNVTIRRGSSATTTDVTGVFKENVKRKYTVNPTTDQKEEGLTFNYRDNVLNFTYIQGGPGALGEAQLWPDSSLGQRAAVTVDDDGTPSSAWIKPTGLKPEADAVEVSMKIIDGFSRDGHPDLHGMVITNACGANPGTTGAISYGATIAHEVGHMFNLGHRVEKIDDATLSGQWNVGTLAPAAGGQIAALTDDKLGAGNGMFCDGLWHPRVNNVMHYNEPPPNAADFDILQALAVRQSPLLDLAI